MIWFGETITQLSGSHRAQAALIILHNLPHLFTLCTFITERNGFIQKEGIFERSAHSVLETFFLSLADALGSHLSPVWSRFSSSLYRVSVVVVSSSSKGSCHWDHQSVRKVELVRVLPVLGKKAARGWVGEREEEAVRRAVRRPDEKSNGADEWVRAELCSELGCTTALNAFEVELRLKFRQSNFPSLFVGQLQAFSFDKTRNRNFKFFGV